MNNPFPLPEKENTTNLEILTKITSKLRDNNLNFYYFLENLERCSNCDEYIIWSYYATNLILNDTTNYPTYDSKAKVIIDIQQGLNKINENN
jgi:hypothetical protein